MTWRRARGTSGCGGGWVAALAIAVTVATSQAQSVRPAAKAAREPIPAARLMETVDALSAADMAGREVGTPGGARARAYLVKALDVIGLPPVAAAYALPFTFRGKSGGAPRNGVNLAVRCEGRTARLPAIVVSAHYDHLGVREGRLYPGADDNASGVAVLLEVARTCKRQPFDHPLLIVFFDAEEEGLRGAKAFVARPPVPREQLALNVNLDMVARGDKGELFAAGATRFPFLRPILDDVATGAAVTLRQGHDRPGTGHDDWTDQSDQGAFNDAGIPFVYFGVEDHPDYHQPSDTADKIDPRFFAGAADTILRALVALDQRLPPAVRR